MPTEEQRPPIDKGFFGEGTDAATGKRKRSELVSFQSAKADSLAPILDQRTENMWGLVERPTMHGTSKYYPMSQRPLRLYEEVEYRPALSTKGSADNSSYSQTIRHNVHWDSPDHAVRRFDYYYNTLREGYDVRQDLSMFPWQLHRQRRVTPAERRGFRWNEFVFSDTRRFIIGQENNELTMNNDDEDDENLPD